MGSYERFNQQFNQQMNSISVVSMTLNLNMQLLCNIFDFQSSVGSLNEVSTGTQSPYICPLLLSFVIYSFIYQISCFFHSFIFLSCSFLFFSSLTFINAIFAMRSITPTISIFRCLCLSFFFFHSFIHYLSSAFLPFSLILTFLASFSY